MTEPAHAGHEGGLPASPPDAPSSDTATRTVPAEARQYQGLRAGLITRMTGAIIDFFSVVAALAGTWLAWYGIAFMLNPTNFSPPSYEPWMALALGWLYAVVYLTVAWATTGRTIGSQLLGLRVVNFRGERMRIGGALVRAMFCTVFSIGLFWIAVSRANRSVQDVVLRTSVIYDWVVRPVDRPHHHDPNGPAGGGADPDANPSPR